MVNLVTNDIEKKWQKNWADAKLFQSNPDERKKLYLTVAFPYPSGAMHIGHGRTYTVPDVYARFKRMEGYNVLFPIGFDAFGLPAENYAIKTNVHPKIPTANRIAHFPAPFNSLGSTFDQ